MSQTSEVSKAQIYVQKKNWTWRLQGEQLNLQDCPLCDNSNYKFYLNRHNGAWDCKVCGASGGLNDLMKSEGDRADGVYSTRDQSESKQAPENLPDSTALHAALLADEGAMVSDRFT